MKEALEKLPPLRDILAHYDLLPQKKLGQNFLLDLNITDKIARSAGPIAGHNVLEIGPGPGGLTRSILKQGPRKFYAIEKDPRCLNALQGLRVAAGGILELISADALSFDEATLEQPLKVIANLPYNIGTELIFKWLEELPRFSDFTLMLQKEVAERIVAEPGGAAYGKLSVMCQWKCETNILFNLPPEVFYPPPKVTSSVIHLKPRPAPLYPAAEESLRKVVQAGFNQRRKMLRGSLKTLSPEIEAQLESIGIAPTARPEDISIADFCKIARTLFPE